MAKQQLAIARFEGGLMADPNPRDIGNNQFSVLKGFSVDSIGAIKMIGAMIIHPTIDANKDATTTFAPGYGLFSFSSDKSDGGVGLATDYLVLTNGDYIHVWDDGGDEWNDMVDTVLNDTNGFSINEVPLPSTTSNDHIWSFYAPDGGLRVSDGEFSNYNNSTKILKYSDARVYGESGNASYPTDFSDATVGRTWIKEQASIEHGLDSNHLKMINLGSVTKGVIEGDSTGTDVISAVSGNDVTIVHAGLDHSAKAWFSDATCDTDHTAGSGSVFTENPRIIQMDSTTNLSVGMVVQGTGVPTDSTIVSINSVTLFTISADTTATNTNTTLKFSKPDDYYNGMTCSFFKDGETTIYGVVRNYNGNSTSGTHSIFSIWCGVNGDVTPATALSGETVADWSFQVGQNEGYLWNSDLNGDARNRGVISSDYGVTLLFDEGNANSGEWMPTSGTRYKFYHTTTFDASSGSLKQQESAPSLFNMYPRKSAAGEETHATVKEMFFCAGDTALATDNTVGTAASSLSVNFGLVVRIRSDNTPDGAGSGGGGDGGAGNLTIGSGDYDETDQDAVDANGTYNFLGGNERVTGGRVYWASSEDGFNSLNLLIDYDLEKGIRPVGSGSGQSSIGGYAKWQSWVYPVASNPVLVGGFTDLESTWFAPPVLESYETINGFRHDAKLDAKFKTSVVANNRVYAANIMRKEKSIFDSLSFTDDTCNYNNDPTIAHDSSLKIKLGMRVTGTGIPDDSYVKSITSLTSFEINQSTTGGNLTDQTLTFIGNGWNITYKDDPVFQDRIIKSPVGKYDTFPDSGGYVIEGFNSDDGDEIIKLESFADRLLVFKKYKVQIYNIQKGEFLEDEVLYNGLDGENPAQACSTDFGIAWINSKGVYFYDGRQVQSLTDGVLRDAWTGESGGGGYSYAFWKSKFTDDTCTYNNDPTVIHADDGGKIKAGMSVFGTGMPVGVTVDSVVSDTGFELSASSEDGAVLNGTLTFEWPDIPIIGFDPDSKKLFCLKTATASGSDDETCLIYSFKTKSWTTLADGSTIDNNTNKRFGHFKGQLIMGNGTQIKVWRDKPNIGAASGQQAFTTKDIDFGTPGVRKKIYKVYITYQSGNATTNVQVKYGVNGSSTQSLTFKDGDYFTGNELLAADGWQVAELKPTTSSQANSKKSFQLALTCDGAVPAAFEIDDITIVYRTKSVK